MKQLLILLVFVPVFAFSQGVCPYCHGTGKMTKNITVSRYGMKSEAKIRCNVCGVYYYPSSGHSHIYCKYCHGTGRLSGSNRYSSSSSSSHSSYDQACNPEAYGIAMSIMYGLPFTDEENRAFMTFSKKEPENARRYAKWRNALSQSAAFFNKCVQMGWTNTGQGGENCDQIKRSYDENLIKQAKTFTISRELQVISQNLWNKYNQAFITYRNATVNAKNMDDMQQRLWDYQLMQLSIP